ncbi:hypothetical protein I546_5614 [Mycobacterium kansasii 732]|nr:hypothetical protein I546_5614 [Mycobacterium kansasii 732]
MDPGGGGRWAHELRLPDHLYTIPPTVFLGPWRQRFERAVGAGYLVSGD